MRASARSAGFFLLAALAGCNVLPDRPTPPALHDFGPIPASAVTVPPAVAQVSAPEWLQDDSIHYRLVFDDPTRLRSYNRDRWLAPPPSLLAQRLSGPAQVRLLDFEQIFDTPTASRVLMRFRATIRTARDEAGVHERIFQLTRPCASPDARGAVTAFAILVGDAERQLRQWLATVPASPTDRPR